MLLLDLNDEIRCCVMPPHTSTITFSALVSAALLKVIGLHDLTQLKAVSDQQFGVDALGLNGLEQHRNRNRIDEPGRDRHVVRPEPLQVQIDFGAVHANIGDVASGGDVLAQVEAGCRRDRS